MTDVFKKRIIKLLQHPDYRGLKLAPLARALGVSSEDYPEFKVVFEELRRAGRVVMGARNLVTLPSMSGRIIGRFRANPKGFGFVIPLEPNSHGDLFIPPSATAEAMTGDIVAARVSKKGKRGGQMRYSGKIVEILERAQDKFVGTLQKVKEGWIVQPEGSGFADPISVDDVGAKGAGPKDKVVVEILSYPTERYLGRGVIVEVLGKAGRYESEIRSIIRQYHLPEEFDESCLEQSHSAASEFNPDRAGDRDDITDKMIITIDPPDAKDFDDAISLEKDEEDRWVLGIHIADVSHFIGSGTPLDVEARERGNSVYLPGRTIPMLPEILSNGICSLQPGQKRFCKSVYLTYDKGGNVLSRSFCNSVIESKQRLTYQEADRVLKGHTKGFKAEVIKMLRSMESLGRLIERRRFVNGMLHLDLPETELVMDKSGQVVDANPADMSYPHTIIEMFMVEANEAVAGFLDRAGVKFMRRIHPEPDSLSMQNLAKFVRALGYGISKVPDRAALQELLESAKGSDSSFAVSLVVLRSLEKAEYAPLDIGHFALASENYCHFTSPIRRYADLLVHRVLQDCMGKQKAMSELDLAEIGKHISFTEQRAEDAERELEAVLVLQMLSKRIGGELDCVVTGLAGFGVFAQSKKFGIEGLVRLEDLGPDVWKYDARRQYVVGSGSGVSVRLGQAMKVRIVSVNVAARQLNVSPTEPLVDRAKLQEAEGKRKGGKKRRLPRRSRRHRR
ncbi:MAG: ribonuclease R [Planctomycetota bacterium]|jgi:ribonuclease R